MKNNILLFVLCTLICVSQMDCKNPTENLRLNVGTDIYKAPVLIQFLNANANSTTALNNVKVTISGKNANMVIAQDGSQDFTVNNGILGLNLTSTAAPSASNPVVFYITAQIPGFAKVSQQIVITEDSPTIKKIYAVETANPADGSAVVSNTSSNVNNGTTTSAITIATSTRATMPEKTTLIIPSGTQLLDASGNVISASSVKTDVVYYGTSSPAAVAALPGGLTAPDALDVNGNAIPGGVHFVTAGFLSINMTAGSTEVKSFSKPVQASVELNANLGNFDTQEPVKAGDTIPVWSLNEATGQWKNEGNALVVNSGGKLVANFSVTHLSGWNLDWGWYPTRKYTDCNKPLKVTIHTTTAAVGTYDVTFYDVNGNYLGADHAETIHDGSVVTFANTPSIPAAYIGISQYMGSPILARTPNFYPCSQGSITLTLPTPPAPEYVNVNLNIKGVCSNKSVNAAITGYVVLYATNGQSASHIIYFSNGAITYVDGMATSSLSLQNNIQYSIYAYIGNQYYSTQATMSKTSFQLPAGQGIIGTATYNATNNTLTIAGTVSIKC